MKTRTTFPTMTAAVLAVLLAACSGNQSEHGSHSHGHDADHHTSSDAPVTEAGAPQFETDPKFQTQLASVFSAYANLQDAFVSSDPAEVKLRAAATADALGEVDGDLLSGAAQNDWRTYSPAMADALKSMQASDDIEEQRKAFSALSDTYYKSARAFGLGGVEAYYAFCPMAFNDEGGYWLDDENHVLNPYFGDKMLRCGHVKEKL